MENRRKPRIQQQRRPDSRPGELLTAALDLFVEKGFSATRLDDIAARAGVTKGTLYVYFDNKVALLNAVVENGILPVLDKGEDLAANFVGSTSDLLRHITHTWWSLVGDSKLAGLCKLMIAEASNFPDSAAYFHEKVIQRGNTLIRGAIEMGIRNGEFRELDVEVAVDSIFSPLLKLILWRHSFASCGGANPDPGAYLDKHLDIVLHGALSGARR